MPLPRCLFLFSPFTSPCRSPAVESLRLHCIVLEGTFKKFPAGTLSHVREVTTRLLFLQTAMLLSDGPNNTKNLKSEICDKGMLLRNREKQN